MTFLPHLEGYITLALGYVAFAIECYALANAVTRRPDAFVAADKRTKGFWLTITGVATLIGFVSVVAMGGSPFGMLGLLAIVGAGVYLADVKPAIDQVMGRAAGGW